MADVASGKPASEATPVVAVAVTQPEQVVTVVAATPASADSSQLKQPETVVAVVQSPAPAVNTATAVAAKPAEPPKPAQPSAADPPKKEPNVFQRQPDDFYNTIFYFSGMGSVIGSALSEGIYVDEKNRRNAIDADLIESGRGGGGGGGKRPEDLVVTARGQAQNLSTDFHRLQSLLDTLPVFTGGVAAQPDGGRRGELDQPIHGELYFRCKERFPVRPTTPGDRRSPRPPSAADQLIGGPAEPEQQRPVRRRQQHDNEVLADVARAAVDAFPLLPPPGRSSSRQESPAVGRGPSAGGLSPSPTPDAGRRRRAEDGRSSNASSSSYGFGGDVGGPTSDGVKSWQMSHVRPYDVLGGY